MMLLDTERGGFDFVSRIEHSTGTELRAFEKSLFVFLFLVTGLWIAGYLQFNVNEDFPLSSRMNLKLLPQKSQPEPAANTNKQEGTSAALPKKLPDATASNAGKNEVEITEQTSVTPSVETREILTEDLIEQALELHPEYILSDKQNPRIFSPDLNRRLEEAKSLNARLKPKESPKNYWNDGHGERYVQADNGCVFREKDFGDGQVWYFFVNCINKPEMELEYKNPYKPPQFKLD